jgi:elongation factor Ts
MLPFVPEQLHTCLQIKEAVTDVAATVRENVILRQSLSLHSRGHIATYVHNAVAPAAGTIAAAVALEADGLDLSGESVPEAVKELAASLAMQVAAMRPVCVHKDEMPPDIVAEERRLLLEHVLLDERMVAKGEKTVERIVNGRLGKFFEEHVLMEQSYILEEKVPVHRVVQRVSKEVGAPLQVSHFAVLRVGERLE